MQAEAVGGALSKLNPGVEIQYHWVSSEGDQLQSGPLSEFGGKGLFTRAVDEAVVQEKADLAVHSLKDLPVDPEEAVAGLAIAAVPKRGPVQDCLISASGFDRLSDLPGGVVVGTSSLRRASQLLRAKPDIYVDPMRGNVDSRLSKVLSDDQPRYDAAVLAVAGLKRLGMGEHTTHMLSLDEMLPAACQGAIAITCRATDHVTLTRCLPLNDPASSTAVHAERELVLRLEASCLSAVAVLAERVPPSETRAERNADSHWFRLRARVLSADGATCLEVDEKCKTSDLRHVIRRVGDDLIKRGARELLTQQRVRTAAGQAVDEASFSA